jgi:ADP-heptose:LPS heptosyltransferase
MKILVNCRGFIGDILFASSLAKKYHEMFNGQCEVHYHIPLIQPLELLENNPYIEHVWMIPVNEIIQRFRYDLIVNIPEVDQSIPATIQMQAAGGIENQSLEFDVYTSPWYDAESAEHVYKLRTRFKDTKPVKVVAYQNDWAWKAYQCTPESLLSGIGAPHRNTDMIIHELGLRYELVKIGFDRTVSQFDANAADSNSFTRSASLIKFCDFFVGSEGGLSNLACAVGTRCIITTDFMEQNYGPHGLVRPHDTIAMGPATYYPDAEHVHLDPCLTDRQVVEEIIRIIDEESYA